MCTADLQKVLAGSKGTPSPQDVPLGDGLARNAKLQINDRKRRIDQAVEQAQ